MHIGAQVMLITVTYLWTDDEAFSFHGRIDIGSVH